VALIKLTAVLSFRGRVGNNKYCGFLSFYKFQDKLPVNVFTRHSAVNFKTSTVPCVFFPGILFPFMFKFRW
jgi:hypothetical protein